MRPLSNLGIWMVILSGLSGTPLFFVCLLFATGFSALFEIKSKKFYDNLWKFRFGSGQWTPDMRRRYNLADANSRHTVQVNESSNFFSLFRFIQFSFSHIHNLLQVYPNSWSAVLASLDNKGMWNLRSAIWSRQYLGQQLYIRVWNNETSLFTEYDVPDNALYCGKAKRP